MSLYVRVFLETLLLFSQKYSHVAIISVIIIEPVRCVCCYRATCLNLCGQTKLTRRAAFLFHSSITTHISSTSPARSVGSLLSCLLCVHSGGCSTGGGGSSHSSQSVINWPQPNEALYCTLFNDCDERFFNKITNNSSHILQQYMPDRTTVNYNLRSRPHNKTLIPKTSDLNERNFLIRNLYKDCY